MWCFLCPPPPCTLFASPRAACAGSVKYAQRSEPNTCMLAHTHYRFLVLANKTTLVVAGACAHLSASRLIVGCAHALLSMLAACVLLRYATNAGYWWVLVTFVGFLVIVIDWCCFYYFLRNSLVALLEALFAWIFIDLRYRCVEFLIFFARPVSYKAPSSASPDQAPVPGCRHASCVLIIHVCLCVRASICACENI